MFPPCSMPSFSTIYSLSWRLWARGECTLSLEKHTLADAVTLTTTHSLTKKFLENLLRP